jgi:pteridine reductase
LQNTTDPAGDSPTNTPDCDLTDKVILVTGAAHRIGAEIARCLHDQGARLILHYRSSRDAAQALQNELNQLRSDTVVLVQADLMDISKLKSLIKESVETWGRLDALVNNASTFFPTPIAEANESQWDNLMGSNLKAPFFLCQSAMPHLKQQHGCIVNIVDIHAERPLKKYPIYSMAKAGLAMMTKSLACELGPEIRVNAVAPGAILWPEDESMDDITKQRILSRNFLKRQGSVSDIARAVLFLIRDANYTSGHILTVDGGRSLNS